jgi:hypothetical protein
VTSDDIRPPIGVDTNRESLVGQLVQRIVKVTGSSGHFIRCRQQLLYQRAASECNRDTIGVPLGIVRGYASHIAIPSIACRRPIATGPTATGSSTDVPDVPEVTTLSFTAAPRHANDPEGGVKASQQLLIAHSGQPCGVMTRRQLEEH